MPDATFVQPLSGSEIVEDLISQIRKKLQATGDLRSTDSYPRGYSAKFNFHVECYGLDTVNLDGEVAVGAHRDDPETVIVEGSNDVPHEPELNAVRQRSEQDTPVLAKTADGGETVQMQKRRYAPRVRVPAPTVESPAEGGTVDFDENAPGF